MSLLASSHRVGVDVMEIAQSPSDAAELKGKVCVEAKLGAL